MIDRDDIVPENVEGKYYVDEECIWRGRASERECDICREEAPNNFARQESEAIGAGLGPDADSLTEYRIINK